MSDTTLNPTTITVDLTELGDLIDLGMRSVTGDVSAQARIRALQVAHFVVTRKQRREVAL